MAFDPRQVLAAFLTMSMFAMLGNMIKKDHFDPYMVKTPAIGVQHDVIIKVEEHGAKKVSVVNTGPWIEKNEEIKPCWKRPDSKGEQSKGFITFSLSTGPEYHLSQLTDAVVIARHLGAALVLPDIRGSELGQKRSFQDMYDTEKFMKSLDGVVKIVKEVPAELASEKPTVVRVPDRVSADFIVKNIKPLFQTKTYLRLATFFPSVDLKLRDKQSNDLDSTSCIAMFGSLELKPDIKRVADTMVERLKTLSRKASGKFIAVDLRVDVLERKNCKESGSNGEKSCYNAQEIGDFLKNIGFDRDTTIYLTETWWQESLNPLKEMFPRSYTKDDIIPAEKKGKFLKTGTGELERALDFHICSESDVFVPAISDLFYGNVAGKRITSGKTQILVPSSSSASDSVSSSFISQKNHWAYSCYCSESS